MRTRLADHGGPPTRKFFPLPHRRKETHRDDSNRKLTTLAIWVHGELERDGLHTANLRGDDVRLNGVDGDRENLNWCPTLYYRPGQVRHEAVPPLILPTWAIARGDRLSELGLGVARPTGDPPGDGMETWRVLARKREGEGRRGQPMRV